MTPLPTPQIYWSDISGTLGNGLALCALCQADLVAYDRWNGLMQVGPDGRLCRQVRPQDITHCLMCGFKAQPHRGPEPTVFDHDGGHCWHLVDQPPTTKGICPCCQTYMGIGKYWRGQTCPTCHWRSRSAKTWSQLRGYLGM